MQRLGRDVMRIDTVRFSNHPAHGGFAGGPAPAAEIDELVDGLAERGFLSQCSAVLSGYLGTAENGHAVARAVERVRQAAPNTLFVCDPVMGDDPKGLFVRPDIPDVFRQTLAPVAEILTPNRFELEMLTGMPCGNQAEVLTAAQSLLAGQTQWVVVTGLGFEPGTIENVAVSADRQWAVSHPQVDAPAFGAGDTFAAIFLARMLEKRDVGRAMSLASASVASILQATEAELALVPAQAAIDAPQNVVPARLL